ncbi:transposase [Streptomyces sp. NPDC088252]|uniref:transposase n=1 Tax=Streptomyces sp. NPDC088252 TaxID=3365845 RepID=UPI0038275D5C
MDRGDLTDTQWGCLETLLSKGKKPGRPSIWAGRQLIDGIRFCTRTGVPRRDVPERYGPWARVHDLFRRWQRHLPQESRLPAPTRHPLHHPGEGRPDPQPQEARLSRRSATRVRR